MNSESPQQKWEPYDPSWLVALARRQHAADPSLAAALERCDCHWAKSRLYIYFVDPTRANEPGALWQFEKNVWLKDEREGDLLLDILQDGRVGGVEFYSRLSGRGV